MNELIPLSNINESNLVSAPLTKKQIAALNKVSQKQIEITKKVDQEKVVQSLERYIENSKASSTRRAYKKDIDQYKEWCKNNNVEAIPASSRVLSAFLTVLADSGLRVSTIERKRAAIASEHENLGLDNPNKSKLVSHTMRGIRKSKGLMQNRKSPITDDVLFEMLNHCSGDDLRSIRDKAILTTAFLGALRRSELVALKVEDLQFKDKGVDVIIRKSKTDQEGKGVTIPLLDGPNFKIKRVLKRWIDSAGIKEGFLFRPFKKGSEKLNERGISTSYFAELVKKYASLIGENEANFSGHSMRRGFMTTAANNKAHIKKMMKISRHTKTDTAIVYIDDAEMYEDHAAESFA